MEDNKKYEVMDLEVVKNPQAVIDYAANVAKLLKGIVSRKAKPVIIKGKEFLEFQDWQTVARFYKVTVRVDWSREIREKDTIIGYEARASAISKDGRELTSAESMCLRNEANWKDKDPFQVRSMAQTRAMAKAYRNIFSWVVVMAGYESGVAEEM